MTYGVTPKSWDGIDIDTDDYMAQFVEDSQSLDNTPAQAVRSTRPGRTPLHSYVQPAEKKYVLEVIILGTLTQGKYDTVAGWFDTIEGADHTLIVTDGDGTDRRIACVVEGFTDSGIGNNVFKVILSSDAAIQLSDTAAGDTLIQLSTPNATFTLTNDGNTAAPLILTISPEAGINADDGYHLGRRIYLANRSEQPLTHFAAEGYAIDITDGGLDTATLEGAGKVMDSLDDLRVFLSGRELLRWCSPATSDAATKIWCNIAMRPGRSALLAADLADDGELLTSDSIDGFEAWDNEGWLFVENEPCVYNKVDDLTLRLTFRPDASAHSAGAVITWIEHVLTLAYGFSAAQTPSAGADSRPVLDLAASSNVEHHRPGPFFNDADRRSMTLRRIVEGDQSAHIRGYDDGDNMIFEDQLPETGKPLADSVELRFPVPAITSLALDLEVGQTMLLHGYVADIEGNESLLIEEVDVSDTKTYAMANAATRLRLQAAIAAVVGSVDTSDLAGAYPFDSGTVGLGVTDYNQGDADHPINLFANIHTAVAFTLSQDTEISGVASRFGATGTVRYSLRTADLSRNYGYGFYNAVADEIAFSGSAFGSLAPVGILPAGDYLQVFDFTAGQSIAYDTEGRTHVALATTLLPEDVPVGGGVAVDGLYTNGLHLITVADEDYPAPAQPVNVGAPVWALLSTKTPPQESATVQTGFSISIDNIITPLDDTRSPLIVLGPEFPLFPLFGTLTNNETGDAAALSFLCNATESLRLDFDNGLVTDNETGLDASYAVQYSNPVKRLCLTRGDNEHEIAIPGVSSSAKLGATPEYRHAWL